MQAISRHSKTRKTRTAGHGVPSFADGSLDHRVDFDWQFYQTAPPDQQLSYLRGDEVVTIEGMHPGAKVLSTSLSGSNVYAFVANALEDMWEPLPMVADTLQIYPHDLRMVISWRGRFSVKRASDRENLRLLVALAKSEEDVALVPVQSLSAEASSGSENGKRSQNLARATLDLESKTVGAPAIPFQTAAGTGAAAYPRVATPIAATPFDAGIWALPPVVAPVAGAAHTMMTGSASVPKARSLIPPTDVVSVADVPEALSVQPASVGNT